MKMSLTSRSVITLTVAVGLASALWAATHQLTIILAWKYHWRMTAISVEEFKLPGVEGCELYAAGEEDVQDSLGIDVARLRNGRWILADAPNALDTVFSQCVSTHAPAGTLADLIVDFYSFLGVINEDSELGARGTVSPRILVERGSPVLHFFAWGGSLLEPAAFQVTARIGNHVSIAAHCIKPQESCDSLGSEAVIVTQ